MSTCTAALLHHGREEEEKEEEEEHVDCGSEPGREEVQVERIRLTPAACVESAWVSTGA